MADTIKDALAEKTLKDLVKKPKVKEVKEPKLTKAKVEECIELLKEVEVNNGHFGVSELCGLTVKQVAEIHAKMEARISELQVPEKEELGVKELTEDMKTAPLNTDSITK